MSMNWGRGAPSGSVAGNSDESKTELQVGDDVEIARHVLADLRAAHGWVRFYGAWNGVTQRGQLAMGDINQAIAKYSGARYRTPSGRLATVRLNDRRIRSIAIIMWRSQYQLAQEGGA